MFTCIIIDDEYPTIEILSDYIFQEPRLILVNSFTNPTIALDYMINSKTPLDILFLDIQMPRINGLEVARIIRHKVRKLIFVTAYPDFAIDSYDLNAADYLLKPVPVTRFKQAIDRIETDLSKKVSFLRADYILIRRPDQKPKLTKLKLADIIAVEAYGKLIKIYIDGSFIVSSSRFASVQNLLLENGNFIQVHRSFIVAIDRMEGWDRIKLKLVNGMHVPIGRKYKKEIDEIEKSSKV